MSEHLNAYQKRRIEEKLREIEGPLAEESFESLHRSLYNIAKDLVRSSWESIKKFLNFTAQLGNKDGLKTSPPFDLEAALEKHGEDMVRDYHGHIRSANKKLVEKMNGKPESLKIKAFNLWAKITESIGNVWTNLKHWVADAAASFIGGLERVLTCVSSLIEKIGDAFSGMWRATCGILR